jgi:Hydantoinase B/oxoprolinase
MDVRLLGATAVVSGADGLADPVEKSRLRDAVRTGFTDGVRRREGTCGQEGIGDRHVSDIGGTKDSLAAREVYEEGLQIPPMKLYRAGVLNEDLMTLLVENVRKSEQVVGDVHAMVSANASGDAAATAATAARRGSPRES